jgi:3-deoxy-7-phosphoheptulonate synthase
MNEMIDIERLRAEIDRLDLNIASSIEKRLEYASEILKLKSQLGIESKSANREKEIINAIISKYESADFREFLTTVLKQFFNYSILSNEFTREQSDIYSVLNLRPMLIAGPCTVESFEQMDGICSELSKLNIKLLRGGAFKPRTSPHEFQGMAGEGLEIMHKVARKWNMFVVSEIMDIESYKAYGHLTDVVQVGSRNMTSYSFMSQLGKATSSEKKPIILKRGFSSTLREFVLAADYIRNAGNDNIILCLRGIRTFEQIDSDMRNTPDLASILELKSMTKLPVIFDPSHSSGNAKYVEHLSKAALTLGADGLMIETHINPEESIIDGKQTITPNQLKNIIYYIKNNAL